MRGRRVGMLMCGAGFMLAGAAAAQTYKSAIPPESPAIRYFDAQPSDPVTRLLGRMERGEVVLSRSGGAPGYLPDLLKVLDIPIDSQALVFSKTSFQAAKISPERPRAVYFNDSVAVAYVPGGDGLEVAGVDPRLGPVFYACTEDESGRLVFQRKEICVTCHEGPNTLGVPGLYVGSVIPNPLGAPLRDDSAIITDHRTEFKDRWGGWYVNAVRGEQVDRANAVASNPAAPDVLDNEGKQNLPDLDGKFDATPYLSPVSDIVALMTFEHQTQMINYMTRLSWEARMGLAADGAVEEMVEYMLFSGEVRLPEPIEGVSTFTKTFPLRGPRDRKGRSLRDFDLETRLFRYPLSYMIYSAEFDALPGRVRERAYRRLYEVLSGADHSEMFAAISKEDRRAVLEILRDTKPDLPAYWRSADAK